MLELVRDIKKQQVNEAKENLNGIFASKINVENRKAYYENRQFKNSKESSHLNSLKESAKYQNLKSSYDIIASSLALVPRFTIGAWSWGTTYGGKEQADAAKLLGISLGTASNYNSITANIASVEGGHGRRQDDWDFQAESARLELKQIEKQIIASEIRLAIAEKDLSNHEIQMDQSQSVDAYLHDKFTNAELYNHMVTQISGIYFQTYQMAYDLAKKAEKSYQFELGIFDSNLIKFGHWDSLKKGLLSGEKLQFDLRRLESSFLENNNREFEITKHISLRRLDPQRLLQIKATGKVDGLIIPEWLFDLDCPGHYKRRIKTVGLSIPCITGPYTSVNCKLELVSSKIRINAVNTDDDNLISQNSNINTIVTSSAQNDNGMFEGNLRDERYLPFEGAGIVDSSWKLELPKMNQFDYNTISDVILHVSYTSLVGNDEFKEDVIADYESKLSDVNDNNNYRLLSLEHDFPNEWHKFVTADVDFDAELKNEHFPYFAQSNRQIKSKELFQISTNGELVPVDKLIDTIDMEIKVENDIEKELATFVIVEYSINF
nr:hypothetical protein [Zobellia uliginosa]